MYCKECGTENLDNSLRCSKCNAYLKSTNLPLTLFDKLKIIGFFAFLILPYLWAGLSIVVILIVIYALNNMRKTQSFTPIENAKNYIQIYLIIILLLSLSSIFSNYCGNKINSSENCEIIIGATIIGAPIVFAFFIFVFDILFFRPLEEH
ncbi:MAG TPA: hypothetical protein EYP05_06470, partial [Piscirickettsiaceae bacterium]|nr:hypothetical protein [Piscirickettsiaceae bacterium]